MAECKDCVHYEVCMYVNAKAVECARAENCKLFKPTTDVVPKSEVERLQAEVERLKKDNEYILMQHRFQRRPSGDCWNDVIEKAKAEVAREIFEEIEGSIAVHAFTSKSKDYADGMYDAIEWVDSKIAELKKKYIGESDVKRDTV